MQASVHHDAQGKGRCPLGSAFQLGWGILPDHGWFWNLRRCSGGDTFSAAGHLAQQLAPRRDLGGDGVMGADVITIGRDTAGWRGSGRRRRTPRGRDGPRARRSGCRSPAAVAVALKYGRSDAIPDAPVRALVERAAATTPAWPRRTIRMRGPSIAFGVRASWPAATTPAWITSSRFDRRPCVFTSRTLPLESACSV